MNNHLILKNTGIYTLELIKQQVVVFFLLSIYPNVLNPADYMVIFGRINTVAEH